MFITVPTKRWNSSALEPPLMADLQGELGQGSTSDLEGHQNVVNNCIWNGDRSQLATASVLKSHCTIHSISYPYAIWLCLFLGQVMAQLGFGLSPQSVRPPYSTLVCLTRGRREEMNHWMAHQYTTLSGVLMDDFLLPAAMIRSTYGYCPVCLYSPIGCLLGIDVLVLTVSPVSPYR